MNRIQNKERKQEGKVEAENEGSSNKNTAPNAWALQRLLQKKRKIQHILMTGEMGVKWRGGGAPYGRHLPSPHCHPGASYAGQKGRAECGTEKYCHVIAVQKAFHIQGTITEKELCSRRSLG